MAEWILGASVLTAVVLLLRRVLRGRVSPRLQYALWAVVLVRLLVPFTFGSSRLSTASLAAALRARPAVQTLQPEQTVQTPAQSAAAQTPDAPGASVQIPETPTIPGMPENGAVPVVQAPGQSADGAGAGRLQRAAGGVWLAGAAAAALVFAASNACFAVRLRRTRRRIGTQGRLPVYETGAVGSPCLFGLLRPAIYVTPEAAGDETVLRHAAAHEAVHFAHGDHVWAVLRGVCLALHWYNPLVWRAATLSRQDAELSCDADTVRRLGEAECAAYGRTLISMTCRRGPRLLAATTMSDNEKSLKERIHMLVKRPKTAGLTLAAVLLVAALAVGCSFTGARQDEDMTLYRCGGLTAALPREDVDALRVTAEAPDGAQPFFSVTQKASAEAAERDGYVDSGIGWLFSLVQYDRTQYERWLCEDGSGRSFFATDGTWYYGLCLPTDVRYYPSGDPGTAEQEQAEWLRLCDLGQRVADDFVRRNGLTAYSDTALREGYTYDGAHRFLAYDPCDPPDLSGNGSQDDAVVLTLSQPAKPGEGGIWCVERMTDGYGNTYLWFPDSGMPAAEYYAGLQAECDAGRSTELLKPEAAARVFLKQSGYFGSRAIDGSLREVSYVPSVRTPDRAVYSLRQAGGMSMTLHLAGSGAWKRFDASGDRYAERLSVVLGGYRWTQTEQPSTEPDDFWLTLESADGTVRMTVRPGGGQAGSVEYTCGGRSEYWSAAPGAETSLSAAAALRLEYDNLEVSYTNIAFAEDGGAEAAAEAFACRVWGEQLSGLAPGNSYGADGYEAVDWAVLEMCADGRAVTGRVEYAFVPRDWQSGGIWAGNTAEGQGAYAGKLVAYREFALLLADDGLWHCADLGTGGVRLP